MLSGNILLVKTGTGIAGTDVIKWRYQAHYSPASASYSKSIVPFVEKIKERTNGRLIIELYPSRALVPNKEILNAVRRGMVEMGDGAPSYFRDKVPLAGVISLPMAFQNPAECAYYLKHLGVEQMLRDQFAKLGVYYSSEKIYHTQLATKKPIRKIDDFNGLKLRSFGIVQKFLTDLGASALYLPGSEVYTALSSGVVDGAHWGAAQGNYSMKFYDVCKYHLKLNLILAPTNAWLVNQNALNKLPKDIKDILICEMEKAFWYGTNWYGFGEEQTLAKIQKELGVEVTTLPPMDVRKAREVAMKIWNKEAKKSPECAKAIKILKDFLKSLGR